MLVLGLVGGFALVGALLLFILRPASGGRHEVPSRSRRGRGWFGGDGGGWFGGDGGGGWFSGGDGGGGFGGGDGGGGGC